MNRNRKKIAKDHIKYKRVIIIPNINTGLAFQKLVSYNFCKNVTYRVVSLGHDTHINTKLFVKQGKKLLRMLFVDMEISIK